MAGDGNGCDGRSVVRRQAPPGSVSRPLVTPIWPSVVYASRDANEIDAQYAGEAPGFTYAREGHPNAAMLAEKIGWLEGMTPAMGRATVTGSGMAAVGALFLGVLKAGDHVVAADQLYGRSLRLLTRDLPRMGVEVSFADATDGAAVAAAMRPATRLVMVEVVSNPTIRIADMETIAEAARRHGALLAIDNTFTTPRGFPAFARGADVVIHSVTKLLAGHSDVTLGWVGARDPEVNAAIEDAAVTWGMTASPFDCWLAERGLASFDLRYERACANAARLAEMLAGEPGVEAVLYPGREDHPDHNRAEAVLAGRHGHMLSFRLRGGRGEVNAFLRAASRIPFAPTLGDVATTLSHPATSSHRAMSEEARAALGITEGFIRLSAGIEDAEMVGRELVAAVRAAAG